MRQWTLPCRSEMLCSSDADALPSPHAWWWKLFAPEMTAGQRNAVAHQDEATTTCRYSN